MITTKSKINFSNLSVPPIIPAVQGDTGRVIQFELNDFTIPAGADATYYVQKPSGEAVYNEATISGNNVLVELTAQSIIEVGENYGQVRILVDEEVVTSFDFILLVKVFRGIEAMQSETEMNIFDKAVERAQETIASTVTEAEAAIEAAAQEAEEYIAQAIDPTLTITDKAADAKVAGDGLKGIAAAFDTQEQYFAGDYVRKDFKLYRRIADCTSVWGDGSWIAAKWQETNLGNEILQRNLIAASRYDHTRDYAVGEYCTHDRWLYRCISPVTGGSTSDIGNWDSTKWEAVRIGEELTDLKEALTDVSATLSTKADKDGTVASAEQLLSDVGTEDKTPYLFRATPYDSTRVDEEVVGCSVGWNQLAKFNDKAETTLNGVTYSISNGIVALSGTASDRTVIGGSLEINGLENHKLMLTGCPVGGGSSTYNYINGYVGTYLDTGNGTIGNNGSSGRFTPQIVINSGTNVDGLKFTPQCFDLTAWFGTTIADYAYSLEQATAGSGVAWIKALLPGGYIPHSAPRLKSVEGLSAHVMRDADENIVGNYPLDSDLTLRGILKMDSDHNVYADGDEYKSDGTVTRKFGSRAYQSGDESLTDAITDGTTTVYKLTTPTTETADPFTSPQNCAVGGTEEYVYAEGGSGVPVGHNSRYQKNMRSELERVSVAVPDAPSSNGTYTLKATVASTGVTYAWVSD